MVEPRFETVQICLCVFAMEAHSALNITQKRKKNVCDGLIYALKNVFLP